MARKNNEVFLLRRNVVAVYPRPIPLEENSRFTLDLRIEQDPLKVFPFREMCVPDALVWIKDNFNLTQEQLIPFLMQMRGLWSLAVNETLPRNSVFKNANDGMPDRPDAPISFGSVLDRWFATRAFRVHVKITIGDEAYVHVLTPGNPEVLCEHVGAANSTRGYKVVPGPPGTPFESSYAKGADNDSQVSQTGGGPNYDFTVSWDEYCIATVHIETYQPMRVSVHVEQDEIGLPGGWGINRAEVVDWYNANVDGVKLCTVENPIGYTMGDQSYDGDPNLLSNPGSFGGLGAYAAGFLMAWTWDGASSYLAVGLGQPRDTPWQGDTTYSVDAIDYDWPAVGEVNTNHFIHTLAYGYTEESDHLPFDPTVHHAGLIGYIRCPALCGAALQALDENNHYTGFNPFASGFVRAAGATGGPGGAEFERIRAVLQKWYAAAKARLALYETVVEPPKVKITATYSAVGAEFEIPEASRYFYANLPYSYHGQNAQYSFGDIYTYVLPNLYHQPKGAYIFDITQQESDDRFSYGTIHAAILNCDFKLDREGFEAHWLPSITDFPGDSTIPETGFYEGEDTFIYNGTNYQDWAGIDPPPPPDWF